MKKPTPVSSQEGSLPIPPLEKGARGILKRYFCDVQIS